MTCIYIYKYLFHKQTKLKLKQRKCLLNVCSPDWDSNLWPTMPTLYQLSHQGRNIPACYTPSPLQRDISIHGNCLIRLFLTNSDVHPDTNTCSSAYIIKIPRVEPPNVTFQGKVCSPNRDSNLGSLAYRANALPIELLRPRYPGLLHVHL